MEEEVDYDALEYGPITGKPARPPDRGASRNWPGYLLAGYCPRHAWEAEEATAKQIEALERRGLNVPPGITKGEASYALDQPTPKQRKALMRWKRWRDGMTFDQAREALDELFGRGRGDVFFPRPVN